MQGIRVEFIVNHIPASAVEEGYPESHSIRLGEKN